ncbi:hypothetical protein WDU94_003905, partial [Cyamophila willieti]
EKLEVGTRWATPAQEALDEVNDDKILKAVQDSMAEYYQRQQHHRTKRAEAKICYAEVGCFQESGPNYIDMLPSAPEEINTRFLLYNGRRGRRVDTPLMDVAFQNMSAVWDWAGKAFNISNPTKVIVHGFGSSCTNVWVYEMRSALMSVEDCNIICVDWENGALIPNYVRAAANTRLVGKQLAMLMAGLEEKVKLPIHNVHMIGFSLGAHVAGFAGAELKNLSRITGLDPAGPLFESQDPRSRLDSTDAQFVDVIHSNGENLILGGLGFWQPMGDVDFYPNGGRMQKGCTNLFVGAVSDILWSATEVYGRSLCNHRRAYKFFTDSVLPRCNFPALACESYEKYLEGNCFNCTDPAKCSNMGYYADKSAGRGTLYLLTRDEEPFCAHQYLVKVQSSPSKLPVVSYGKIQITLIGDLQLNETFTITQKDDEELRVGGMVSRIIVPHPALQVFTSVQIMYTSYTGWISSGLARWSVEKILLTDTSGSSLSICKKDLVLETGVPQLLPLFPGDCKITESSNTDVINETLLMQNLLLVSNKSKPPFVTQVVKIGDEIIPKKNKTSTSNIDITLSADPELNGIGVGVTDYFKSPWDPEVDLSNTGNSLDGSDKDNAENSGRGFLSLEKESQSPNVSRSFRESGSKNWNINHDSKNTSDQAETDSEDKKVIIVETALPTTTNDSDESVTYVPDISITMNYSSVEEYWSTSVKPTIDNKSAPYEFVTEKSTVSTTTLKEIVNKTNTTTPKPEIKEPVLKPKSARSRSTSRIEKTMMEQNRWKPREDLNPPAMGATESWHHWEENSSKSPRNIQNLSSKSDVQTSSEKPKSLSFTVQFLPQKLLQFFEQAEKYAKLAFSPFMSDDKSSDNRSQRRLKYLPQFLFGKEVTSHKPLNESKKQETDMKGTGDEKSKMVLPYSTNVESSFQPQFIPLTEGKQKDSDLTDEPIVRISRPETHMDSPVVNSPVINSR